MSKYTGTFIPYVAYYFVMFFKENIKYIFSSKTSPIMYIIFQPQCMAKSNHWQYYWGSGGFAPEDDSMSQCIVPTHDVSGYHGQCAHYTLCKKLFTILAPYFRNKVMIQINLNRRVIMTAKLCPIIEVKHEFASQNCQVISISKPRHNCPLFSIAVEYQ